MFRESSLLVLSNCSVFQSVELRKEDSGSTHLLYPRMLMPPMSERPGKLSSREMKLLGNNASLSLSLSLITVNHICFSLCISSTGVQESIANCNCDWGCCSCWVVLLPQQYLLSCAKAATSITVELYRVFTELIL